jgi:hypothetical protein
MKVVRNAAISLPGKQLLNPFAGLQNLAQERKSDGPQVESRPQKFPVSSERTRPRLLGAHLFLMVLVA